MEDLVFLIDEMDDSRKLRNQTERRIISNCEQLPESNCNDEKDDDKKSSNKITVEECSKFKSTILDRLLKLQLLTSMC
uniref:Uncharacterized protein n=1 Tax=Elaeophora elaphi TaxID=1147741 RepID=A0A0R3S7G3_9BILA